MKMKKRDIGLIGIVLLIAFLCWLIPYIRGQFTYKEAQLRITVDGEEYGVYSLEDDQVIHIGDTNVCVIKDGYVSMTEADCPDHLCMKQKRISKEGGTIVCLPNRVVLEITGDESLDAPDVVAS
ncbi:NusG domain II-containing protein [Blautia pseudococcoides]|uniref:NusG domain II-containing protein n=1 Tax=Blautia pseudococcoides TaxID=1796616 RepID=UPI00148B1C88|nr:NusG domain II-containing protein [Blautia pseudococcoides]